MTTRLAGAAAKSQARRIILDAARTTMHRRDPDAVGDVLALLRAADANDTRRKPTDADLLASIARTTQTLAAADECYRCPTDPAGRIDPLEPEPGLCRACLDEVSHAAEERRYREAAASLADDEWGE